MKTNFIKFLLVPLITLSLLTSCTTNDSSNQPEVNAPTYTNNAKAGISFDYQNIEFRNHKLTLPINFRNTTIIDKLQTENIVFYKRNEHGDYLETSDIKVHEISTINSTKALVTLKGSLYDADTLLEANENVNDYVIIIKKDNINYDSFVGASLKLKSPSFDFKIIEQIKDGEELIFKGYIKGTNIKNNGIRKEDVTFTGDFSNAYDLRYDGENTITFKVPTEGIILEDNFSGQIIFDNENLTTAWGEKIDTPISQYLFAKNLHQTFISKDEQAPIKGALGIVAMVVTGAVAFLIGKLLGDYFYSLFSDAFGVNEYKDETKALVKDLNTYVDQINENIVQGGADYAHQLNIIENKMDSLVFTQVQEYYQNIESFPTDSMTEEVIDILLEEDNDIRNQKSLELYENMKTLDMSDYVSDVYKLGSFLVSTGLGSGDSLIGIYDNFIANSYNWFDEETSALREVWIDNLYGQYFKGIIVSLFFYQAGIEFENRMFEEQYEKRITQVQEVGEETLQHDIDELSQYEKDNPLNLVTNTYYCINGKLAGRNNIMYGCQFTSSSLIEVPDNELTEDEKTLRNYNKNNGLYGVGNAGNVLLGTSHYEEMQRRAVETSGKSFFTEFKNKFPNFHHQNELFYACSSKDFFATEDQITMCGGEYYPFVVPTEITKVVEIRYSYLVSCKHKRTYYKIYAGYQNWDNLDSLRSIQWNEYPFRGDEKETGGDNQPHIWTCSKHGDDCSRINSYCCRAPSLVLMPVGLTFEYAVFEANKYAGLDLYEFHVDRNYDYHDSDIVSKENWELMYENWDFWEKIYPYYSSFATSA